MAIETDTSITTSLLTLLNVSATKAGKRKLPDPEFIPAEKLNKRKSARFSDSEPTVSKDANEPKEGAEVEGNPRNDDVHDDVDGAGVCFAYCWWRRKNDAKVIAVDSYERHFGLNPVNLTEEARASVDGRSWKISKQKNGKLGSTVLSLPTTSKVTNTEEKARIDILERLRTPFQSRQSKQSQEQIEMQNDLLSTLSLRRDLYLTSVPLESRKATREAIALHAVNHVTKKRRRVLKNNDRLAHAAKTNPNAEPPEDIQDQGFTRPSVLVLLPFRSAALDWFSAITVHTPSPIFQIENQARFASEYGLPQGVIDKLAEAEPGTYPRDHMETFKGNVDDNFRVGIKMTRKSVKMFAEFYSCDIIMASPLGLRRSIEKEK
ncbi:hypothetical protein H0H81_007651 [Sphagnurus paluster]|uniref:UTP25 NTP hydrolase-like domain-containing protein n=1 Tax=Sphagnurus paluster TaxID=117069 RepID=A0A9P7FVT7_9AGAR|nr:hypothetical protein H0H81_007651 [Sphagnurus paluster]